MGMDPRMYGFRPGNYEYRSQDDPSQPNPQDLAPNTYRIPFFGSWRSVIVRTVAIAVVVVVLVLAAFVIIQH